MANKKTGVQLASETLTTNGEMPDVASPDSIKRFATAAKRMGRDLNANGITAHEIKRLSRRIDIQRANSEIHWAVGLNMRSWVMAIKTQASAKHGASSHMVHVQFLGYKNAIASMGTKKPVQIAKEIAAGAIKYDCDCGRHRYWYRFIADTGGWAYGKSETRFPNIRNPRLTGIACKHMIRVAHELENSRAIHNMIAKFLDKPVETVQNNEERIKKRMLENKKHIMRVNGSKMVASKDFTKPNPATKKTPKPIQAKAVAPTVKKQSEAAVLKQAMKLIKAGKTDAATAMMKALAKQQGKT